MHYISKLFISMSKSQIKLKELSQYLEPEKWILSRRFIRWPKIVLLILCAVTNDDRYLLLETFHGCLSDIAKRKRASTNHATCTMQYINTSYEGRAIHHAYRYAGFGDVYILPMHPLHQRVTSRIIRDLHLLFPVASASSERNDGHRT